MHFLNYDLHRNVIFQAGHISVASGIFQGDKFSDINLFCLFAKNLFTMEKVMH